MPSQAVSSQQPDVGSGWDRALRHARNRQYHQLAGFQNVLVHAAYLLPPQANQEIPLTATTSSTRTNLYLHIFKGEVSMEYGGGFASVRTDYENWKIGKFKGFILKVRGDGKTYQFRCRLGNSFDGVAYRHYFQANDENWKEILLPFNEFVPTYRGKILKDSAPMDPESIRHLGLMISDKQSGNFRLEIVWIGVY